VGEHHLPLHDDLGAARVDAGQLARSASVMR
jgi:hypothetical protein